MAESEMPLGTRLSFQADRPDEMMVTGSLTMPLSAWRKLMRELPADGSTAGRLGLMVAKLLGTYARGVDARYDTTGYSGATVIKSNPKPEGEG